ncbi:MAG TPA: toxin glutamine deamidase domain-containing protein, partial [Kineosporiaceae bacterium]|nr:toxin glutamine deamidase domain-containing protein [Kineosporiaceae bacterium]
AAITGAIGGALGPIMQGLGHYPTKALGHALGGILGKNAGHEAGHWAGETIRGGVHEWLTDGASGAAQHQGWKPDTFSTTAGALDEGISGLAGMGGRKGGHRYYTGMLRGGAGVPDTNIHIPDKITLDPTSAASGPTVTRVAGFPTPAHDGPAGPPSGAPAPLGAPGQKGDSTPAPVDRFMTSAPAGVSQSLRQSGTAAASAVTSSPGAARRTITEPGRSRQAQVPGAGPPPNQAGSAAPVRDGTAVVARGESALPSLLPPAVQAEVWRRVRSILGLVVGPAPEAVVARLAVADAVHGLLAPPADRSLPAGARPALVEASASVRQAVVHDLSEAGRERSARDAAALPEREAELEAGRQAERRSLWAAELHATLAEDPQAALAMLRDRQLGADPTALDTGRTDPGTDTGRTDPAGSLPSPAETADEIVTVDDPQPAVRGLPAELGHALNGLAPVAQQVVVSGLPVEVSVRLLDRLRDSLVDVAVAQWAPGTAVPTPGETASPADRLRAELIRRWDNGPGVVPGMGPGSWAGTLAEARAASDLLRPADDPGAARPTSVPVNAVTTRVEAFADAFAAVLTGTIGAQAADGLDAGVSVFEAQLARDLALVNPGWDPAVAETTSNCVHVVNGYELRRRGYDVQARPLPEHLVQGGGRMLEEIELAWRRPFTRVKGLDALDQAFAAPGSRGIVEVLEQSGPGGGHVFNVENVNGQVRYLDAQRSVPDAQFFFATATRAQYLRLDDLTVPWAEMDTFVQPADPSARPLSPLVADPTADGRKAYDRFARDRVRAELDAVPPVVVSALPAELPRVHALEVARRVLATLAPLPESGRDAAWAHLATSEALARMVDEDAHRYTEADRRAFQDAALRTVEPAILDDLAALGRGLGASRRDPGVGAGEVAPVQGLPPMIGSALEGLPAMADRIVDSHLPADTGARLLERLHQALVDGALYEAHARTGSHPRTVKEDSQLKAALTQLWRAAPETSHRRSSESWADTLTRARTTPGAVPGSAQPVNAATRRAQDYAGGFAHAYTRLVGEPAGPGSSSPARRTGRSNPLRRWAGSRVGGVAGPPSGAQPEPSGARPSRPSGASAGRPPAAATRMDRYAPSSPGAQTHVQAPAPVFRVTESRVTESRVTESRVTEHPPTASGADSSRPDALHAEVQRRLSSLPGWGPAGASASTPDAATAAGADRVVLRPDIPPAVVDEQTLIRQVRHAVLSIAEQAAHRARAAHDVPAHHKAIPTAPAPGAASTSRVTSASVPWSPQARAVELLARGASVVLAELERAGVPPTTRPAGTHAERSTAAGSRVRAADAETLPADARPQESQPLALALRDAIQEASARHLPQGRDSRPGTRPDDPVWRQIATQLGQVGSRPGATAAQGTAVFREQAEDLLRSVERLLPLLNVRQGLAPAGQGAAFSGHTSGAGPAEVVQRDRGNTMPVPAAPYDGVPRGLSLPPQRLSLPPQPWAAARTSPGAVITGGQAPHRMLPGALTPPGAWVPPGPSANHSYAFADPGSAAAGQLAFYRVMGHLIGSSFGPLLGRAISATANAVREVDRSLTRAVTLPLATAMFHDTLTTYRKGLWTTCTAPQPWYSFWPDKRREVCVTYSPLEDLAMALIAGSLIVLGVWYVCGSGAPATQRRMAARYDADGEHQYPQAHPYWDDDEDWRRNEQGFLERPVHDEYRGWGGEHRGWGDEHRGWGDEYRGWGDEPPQRDEGYWRADGRWVQDGHVLNGRPVEDDW